MDLEKKLQFLTGNDEYSMPVKPSHTDDDNSPIEVVAKDRDGNVIPDYPMPTNVDQLQFSVNMTTQSAEDELHRKYHVERV